MSQHDLCCSLESLGRRAAIAKLLLRAMANQLRLAGTLALVIWGNFWGPSPLICNQDYCTTCERGQPPHMCTEAFWPPQQPSFMPLTNACRQLFDIELQPGHVWELDSSQPNKFSRHIVVCLPKAAFACSAAVGKFVAHLLARHEVRHTIAHCTCLQKKVWRFNPLCTGSNCL